MKSVLRPLANLQAPVLQHYGRLAMHLPLVDTVPCLQARVTIHLPRRIDLRPSVTALYVAAEDMLVILDFGDIGNGFV